MGTLTPKACELMESLEHKENLAFPTALRI